MDAVIYLACHLVLPILIYVQWITAVQSLGFVLCSVLNYYALFDHVETSYHPEPLGTFMAFSVFTIMVGFILWNPSSFEFTF